MVRIHVELQKPENYTIEKSFFMGKRVLGSDLSFCAAGIIVPDEMIGTIQSCSFFENSEFELLRASNVKKKYISGTCSLPLSSPFRERLLQ